MKIAQNLDALQGEAAPNFGAGSNIGDIISSLLTYLFPIAGIVLLLYLLYGGYKYMLSGGDQKAIEEGKNIITNAVVGFIIIFVAFWIMQALGLILGIEALLPFSS